MDVISRERFQLELRAMVQDQLAEVDALITGPRPVLEARRAAWRAQQDPAHQQGIADLVEGQAEHMASVQAAMAHDAVFALIDLLGLPPSGRRVWVWLTVARSVVEPAVRYSYLVDCTLSAPEALAHCVAVAADGLQQGRKTQTDFGEAPQEAEARWQRLQAACGRAGVRLTRGQDPQSAVAEEQKYAQWVHVPGAQPVKVGLGMTAEVSNWIDQVASPYRYVSGAAHAEWWFLQGTREPVLWPADAPEHLAEAVKLTLSSLVAMARAWSAVDAPTTLAQVARVSDERVRMVDQLLEVVEPLAGAVGS